MKGNRAVLGIASAFAALFVLSVDEAQAAWASTEFFDVDIYMDNGKTYFRSAEGSLVLGGNCLHNRLELRETGDRFEAVENGRRIMALILAAKLAGKRVSLGYDDTDGPTCRVAQVRVEW